MKSVHSVLVPALAVALAGMVAMNAHAQTRIYRCGNTYTNDASEAQAKGCKPMEGGNVTIVEGTRANPPPRTPVGAGAASTPAQRIDSGDQRARDADARQILEAELKKAEARHAELLKEYNNGEPEKQGGEARNYQKYLDRVAEMKAEISRNESDIAGIRREIGRLPAQR
jgi:hypothetical protein